MPWTIQKKGTESNSLILQSKNRDTEVLSSTGDNRLTQTRLFSPGIIPFYSSYCSEKIQHTNGFPVLESSQMSCQRRQWHPISVLLPGKPQGRGSLVGCSPRGRRESETTEATQQQQQQQQQQNVLQGLLKLKLLVSTPEFLIQQVR